MPVNPALAVPIPAGVPFYWLANRIFDLRCRAVDHASKVLLEFSLELARLIEKAFGQDGKPLRTGVGMFRRQGCKGRVELAQQIGCVAKILVVGNHGLTHPDSP